MKHFFSFSLFVLAVAGAALPAPAPGSEAAVLAARGLVDECAARTRTIREVALAKGGAAAAPAVLPRGDVLPSGSDYATLLPRLEPICPELVELVRREPDIGDFFKSIGDGIKNLFGGTQGQLDDLLGLLDGVTINGADIGPCLAVLGPTVLSCGAAIFKLGNDIPADADCILKIIQAVPQVPAACSATAEALKTCIVDQKCDLA